MTVPDYTHLRELLSKSIGCYAMVSMFPDELRTLLDRFEALEKVRADAERYRALRDLMAQVYGDMPARGFHVEAPTRQELDESWDALSQSLAAERSTK